MGCLAGYFIGVPVAHALMNTRLGYDFLTPAIQGKLPDSSAFQTSLAGLDTSAQQSAMSAALKELSIPVFFHGMFTARAIRLDSTVSLALASSFAFWILIAVFFLLFFLVGFILTKAILGKHGDREEIFGDDGKAFLGRVAGMLRSLLTVSFIIFGLMMVIVLISQLMISAGNTSFQEWLSKDLRLTASNSFSIGRIFYNSASSFLEWITLRMA